MATYFPYSHIIQNLCNTICKSINKHSYFGEWSVGESEQPIQQSGSVEISEIYY